MNSVLQCLSNIQDLKHFLKTEFTKGSLLPLYAELMKAMSFGYDLQEPLNRLKHYTSKHSSSFHGYSQADAREFLNVLLNAFHDELIKYYPQFPINQWFTITIESQMICKMCGHTESTAEPMNFLPLRLNAQDKSKTKLDDLLHTFKKEKIINGQLQCLRCRQISEHCERRIIGSPLPNVIIVHFTRFSSTRTKDDTAVVLPLMYNFSDSSRSNQSSYELIGVITHMGSIHGGHFIAYTKYHQNEWYCCDDAIVHRIGQLDPMKLARDAYILFYAKQY
jgi:ubiquitin C-terminal hydrolase